MKETDRTRKVAELIKRELATIMPRELNDSRINCVTVTSVSVTRDLKQSIVYVCSGEDQSDPQLIEKLLNNASGFLRKLISERINLRITPTLVFKYDDTIDRGMRMTQLLRSLNKNSQSDQDDE